MVSELRDGLLRLTLTGEYTYDDIVRAFEAGLTAAGPARTRVLWDASAAGKAPDPRGVERLIALLDRCRARLARVAVVGHSPLMFGVSRQIAQTLDSAEIPVRAFWDAGAAKAWLGRRDSGVHSQA